MTAPAANASRMKSASRMDMRRVVPGGRERDGRAVEDDAAADEHEPLDEALDGAELVRDEQDRDVEVAVEPVEQRRERLLRADVDACGRLVEDDQLGLRRERLRDERTLPLTA